MIKGKMCMDGLSERTDADRSTVLISMAEGFQISIKLII